MTDTSDIGGNVVPLKSAKPKVVPALEEVDDLGLADVPFAGSFNPEAAALAYATNARDWSGFNQARSEEGVLGLDGIIIELAFSTAAKPTKAELLKLAAVATLAAGVVE